MKRTFSRWTPALGETWAFRLFKRHHTEINDLYWSHRTGFRGAFAACRGRELTDHPSMAFQVPTAHASRLPATLCDWVRGYKEFDNWVRLSGLVSIAGYLEVYMKTAVRLALESDPGAKLGAPRQIDGVIPLKRTSNYSSKDDANLCGSGEWQSRVNAYRRFFHHCPASLEKSISTLEFLRKTRNGVAHTFGRSVDEYDALAQARPKELKRVSHDHFIDLLGLVNMIVTDVEAHLGLLHIGDYESIYCYHQWLENSPFEPKSNKALRVRFERLHGQTVGKPFCDGLIVYYNQM